MAFSTDVIVGFPTENDQEFQDTYDVMKKVEFDSAFMFKYSQRKNTIASRKYKDDVPDEKKTERIVKINELQKKISLKKNQSHIDEIHNILIESQESAKSNEQFCGRFSCMTRC